MNFLTIIAETTTDPLSGGAGWVGAGLLGLVLGWLLWRHLPEKDRQLKEILDTKDAQLQKSVDDHAATVREVISRSDASLKLIRDDNRSALEHVLAHCDKEMQSLATILGKDLDALGKAVDALASAIREMDKRKVR